MAKSNLLIYDLEEKEKVGLCSKELNLAAYLKDLTSLYARLSERDCFVPSPHYFSKAECIDAANFLASRKQPSSLLCYAQLFMPESSLCQEIFLLDTLVKLRSLSHEGESLAKKAREQQDWLIYLHAESEELVQTIHQHALCPPGYNSVSEFDAVQAIVKSLEDQSEQIATQAQLCTEALSAILPSEADVDSRLFKSADSTDSAPDSEALQLARSEIDRIAAAYPREVWILRNSYVSHEVDSKWRNYVPAREFIDRQGLALKGLSWLLKSHQYLISVV